ncbi:MAG: hypothetical protein LQ340_000519 [Diploschistes diacapsis]|nr:MAG: hypothetical protein LQ340_000519 [Diploschistes diacapsis]
MALSSQTSLESFTGTEGIETIHHQQLPKTTSPVDSCEVPFPCLSGLRKEAFSNNKTEVSWAASHSWEWAESALSDMEVTFSALLQASCGLILAAYCGLSLEDISFRFCSVEDFHRCADPSDPEFAWPVRFNRTKIVTNRDVLQQLCQYGGRPDLDPHDGSGVESLPNTSVRDFRPIYLRDFVLISQDGADSHFSIHDHSNESTTRVVLVKVMVDSDRIIEYRAIFSDKHLSGTAAVMMLRQLNEIVWWILSNPDASFKNAMDGIPSHLKLKASLSSVPLESTCNQSFPLLQSQFEHRAVVHAADVALSYVEELDDGQLCSREWSYGSLNFDSIKLAQYLLNQFGNLRGTIIPILMHKEPHLYITILAVLKSGSAWCPIDPLAPAERRYSLIARTESSILLTSSGFVKESLEAKISGLRVLDVPETMAAISGSPSDPRFSPPALSKDAAANGPAYLIWTSGTTGPPKGVVISHSAAVTSMVALQKEIPNDPVRCMQFSQHTFDVFVQDLFYTWGLGGTVIAASRELMTGSFARLANFAKATHAHLTPSFAADLPRSSCPTLRVVTMIGERLAQHVADAWNSEYRSYNTYGPAEAAVVSTVAQIGGFDGTMKSANIGRPLNSVSCHVLQNGKVAMVNAIGELALGGCQLADGYFKDPVKTAEKFVWNDEIGERLYLTGDNVRMLSCYNLEFLGRLDDLVKIQGIRVELSEISFALSGCHDFAKEIHTLFLRRRDRPARIIVTFISMQMASSAEPLVVLNHTAVQIATAAMAHARQSLPDYMVPSAFVVIDHMPYTTSTKLNKRELEKMYACLDIAEWESKVDLEARSESERQNWTQRDLQVLEAVAITTKSSIKAISGSSYLPALGIDSLASGKLCSRLQEADLHVSVADILRCRTINDLLKCVGADKKQKPPSQASPSLFREDQWLPVLKTRFFPEASIVLPATPLQEGLLVEAIGTRMSYWNNRCFNLPPDIDVNWLRSTWQEVCDRTEALRTTFITKSEVETSQLTNDSHCTFVQVINSHWAVDWSIIGYDKSSLAESCRLRAQEIAHQCAEAAFKRPPWAVTLFKGAEKDRLTMMIAVHHILHDEISFQYLLSDLWNIYGRTKSVPRRRQMHDAIPKIYNCLSSYHSRNFRFWEEQLKGYAEFGSAQLPNLGGDLTCGSRNAAQAMVSKYLEVQIPEYEMNHVVQLLQVSPASFFRAAWGYILLQYFEVPKIVFGDATSERIYYPELADAIAPLLSVVPIAFESFSTPRELLQRHEKNVLLFREHRSISATTVRKLMGRPQRQPLYVALFNYFQDSNSSINPWEEIKDLVGLSVEHPLALNVQKLHASDKWALEVYGDRATISSEHLGIVCQQVAALVPAMIGHLDKPIPSLFTVSLRDAVSHTRSEIKGAFTSDDLTNPTRWASLHESVDPGWAAVEVADKIKKHETSTVTWNFATLDKESNKIAGYLCDAGLRRETVAMCTTRSLISYAAILGIFKSGNTYLPIDDSLPKKRKLFLLADSHASIIFTDSICRTAFTEAPLHCRVVNLDSQEEIRKLSVFENARVLFSSDPNDNAYLLYTSGSTGQPKGVFISYRNLCNFVEGLVEVIGNCFPKAMSLRGRGKFLGLASRAFDVHICEIFLGWRLGLCAVTAPREVLLDDLRLALTELKVTHACFVPTLLDQAGLEPDDVPELTYFSVGGEKITPKILEVWGSQNKTLVVNAYGPTELAIGCCASRVTSQSDPKNIGRPFGNTVVHVLIPETFDYAIRGQSGELCVSGELVGNGYLKRPDAVGFVDDFNGQKMYRTGDIVRMMADGSLEYLGRNDDQTKIRGQRIELGEVSECIKDVVGMGVDVASLVLQHPDRQRPQLVSFIAPALERQHRYGAIPCIKSAAPAAWSEARAGCRERLAGYMLPDHVIPTSVIPLALSSGKVDVKLLKYLFVTLSLPQLFALAKEEEKKGDVRRRLTEDEEIVAGLAHEALSVERVNILHDTNLFELGLNSLSAVSLSGRLRKAGFDCNLRAIFSQPTVEKIAHLPKLQQGSNQYKDLFGHRIARLRKFEERIKNSTVLNLNAIETVRPCLPLQEGFVVRSLDTVAEPVYISNFLLKLQSNVRINGLKDAWSALIANTPILRTCFRQIGSKIVQVVLRADAVPLQWKEVSQANEENSENLTRQVQQRAFQDIMARFEDRPPLRFYVMTVAGTVFLSLSIHHALFDAVSLNLMFSDVHDLYQGQIPKPRTSFDELLGYVFSQDQLRQQSFWTRYLTSYDSRSTLAKSADAEDITFEQDLSLKLSTLRSLASNLKVTLSTLCHTCFGVVLSQLLGQDDVVFGIVLSGRTVPIEQPENILSPCMTTIPQRIKLNDSRTLAQVMSEAQSELGTCLEFQHTSPGHINRWVGAGVSLFECLFQYLGEAETHPSWTDLWAEGGGFMNLDNSLTVEIKPNQEIDSVTARIFLKSVPNGANKATTFIHAISRLFEVLLHNPSLTVDEVRNEESNTAYEGLEPKLHDELRWSPNEKMLRDQISEVAGLHHSYVTKNVSFFQLGIDSVTAMLISSAIRRKGLHVQTSDLMQYPNIGSLVEYLGTKDKQKSKTTSDGTDLQPDDFLMKYRDQIPIVNSDDEIKAAYACTPLQNGMITATLAANAGLYLHHHVVRLNPNIIAIELHRAWQRVMEANEILRTSFHLFEPSSAWIAAVHGSTSTGHIRNATAQSLENYLYTVGRRMVLTTKKAFATPPLEASILKTPSDRFFVLSMHHALYDGISMMYLFDELALAYQKHALPNKLPFHQAATLIHQKNVESVTFWVESLKNYTGKRLVEGRSVGKNHTVRNEKICRLGLHDTLEKAQRLGVTLQTVALLAFGKVLAIRLERRDVVFGHVVSGRSLYPDDRIIGPLFNTVPLRIRFPNLRRSNKHSARKLQVFTGASQDHLHAPLQTIQNKWRRLPNSRSANLFDALFLFQKGFDKFGGEGLWTPVELSNGSMNSEYALNFELEQRLDRLILRASCAESLMSKHELTYIMVQFEEAVLDILDHPKYDVTCFPRGLDCLPLEAPQSYDTSQDEPLIGRGSDAKINDLRLILAEVSGLSSKSITVDTSIFRLGLDSVSAIKVASLCREKELNLCVADIIQGQTLYGIWKRLSTHPQNHDRTMQDVIDVSVDNLGFNPLKPHEIEAALPCLGGQEYHIANWHGCSGVSYYPTFAFSSTEKLDITRLQEAWDELRSKWSILRTTFVATAMSKAAQMISKPLYTGTSIVETHTIDSPRRTNLVLDQISFWSNQAFKGLSPVRLVLLRNLERDMILLTIHHALYDAWTIPTMISDLDKLYHNYRLDPKPDFSEFVRYSLQQKLHLNSKAYWQRSLKNKEISLLPSSANALDSKGAGKVLVSLPSALTSLSILREDSRKHNLSLSSILILAFARLIAHATSTENPTFGNFHHGRSSSFPDIEAVPGPTLNVLPLVICNAISMNTVEAAKKIQTDLATRIDYGQDSLTEVLSWAAEGAEQEDTKPLFNAFVNILPCPPGSSPTQEGQTPLFELLDLGPPSQLMTTGPSNITEVPQGQGKVPKLVWPCLAKEALYVDIVLNEDGDRADLVARAEGGLMDEARLRKWLGDLVKEVEDCAKGLGEEGEI